MVSGVSTREQRLVFGEVAEEYDAVRPGYPADLVAAVMEYASHASIGMVESGAGTGIATEPFAAYGTPLTCVEPDPEMATLLARRFAGMPNVSVVVGRFEDWPPPPGGVGLVYAAQSWHWVEPETGFDLAWDALVPGGAIALFGHVFAFADEAMRDALDAAYERIAPQIAAPFYASPHQVADGWYEQLCASPRWTDEVNIGFETIVSYSTVDYLRLLRTLSPHLMLPADTRTALHDAIATAVEEHGGVVRQLLNTRLTMARTVAPG